MNNEKLLVKMKFGSHLYGTNTITSDIDYKVIYLPTLDSLLLREKDVVYKDRPVGVNESMSAGEEETEYLSVHKFVNDFFSGQAWAIECAFAIISEPKDIVTIYDENIKNFTICLVNNFLTKDIRSMVSYAIHQSQMYGTRAERLEALSKLISVLEKSDKNSTLIEIKSELEQITNDVIYFSLIKGHNKNYENLPSLKVNNRDYHMTAPVGYVLQEMKKLMAKYGDRVRKANTGENIDWKALMHAIRIVKQAIDLVDNHVIEFPLPYAEHLLDIRNGKLDFNEVVKEFESLNRLLDSKINESTLSLRTESLRLNLNKWFLSNLYQNFYKINMEE